MAKPLLMSDWQESVKNLPSSCSDGMRYYPIVLVKIQDQCYKLDLSQISTKMGKIKELQFRPLPIPKTGLCHHACVIMMTS